MNILNPVQWGREIGEWMKMAEMAEKNRKENDSSKRSEHENSSDPKGHMVAVGKRR